MWFILFVDCDFHHILSTLSPFRHGHTKTDVQTAVLSFKDATSVWAGWEQNHVNCSLQQKVCVISKLFVSEQQIQKAKATPPGGSVHHLPLIPGKNYTSTDTWFCPLSVRHSDQQPMVLKSHLCWPDVLSHVWRGLQQSCFRSSTLS